MIPPPDPGSLGQLAAQGLKLRLWCNRCGHAAQVPAAELVGALGPGRPVYGAWTAFRCSACGASGRRRGDLFSMPEWPPVPMGLGKPD